MGIQAKGPGLVAGIGYEIRLGNRLSLVPGILYSSIGDRLVADTGEGDQVLAGIIVPIELKLNFNGPFITAGPYLGLTSSARLDDGTSQGSPTSTSYTRIFRGRLSSGWADRS
jgi:hypothetical protein